MYIDLNVPVPLATVVGAAQSKKSKGKQLQQPQSQHPTVVYTPGQLAAMEGRLDLLEHLGYTVFGLNQTVQKKIDSKTHANTLEPLLQQLRKRERVAFVKRLTIVLDEDSEKGFGLTIGNASIVAPYDIIALLPTTATTFSQACLSHTVPSNLTAHIITLPLTLPRLPFNLKHTMVRTAIKNGAVFEIPYAGALGGENDPAVGTVGGSEGGAAAKRNWWASAREIVRVSKGKGLVITSGVTNNADLRAPRDVGNLIKMLDLAQNLANDAATKTPQSLLLRAQTRKTYRAVLSEPRIVVPASSGAGMTSALPVEDPLAPAATSLNDMLAATDATATPTISSSATQDVAHADPDTQRITPAVGNGGKKRAREDDSPVRQVSTQPGSADLGSKKKKKRQQHR